MKFLHTADLHIGKKIFEQSLIEDQKYILDRIYQIAVEEYVDVVVIAGDIYDRAIPSAEAVTLLDDFLTRLIQKDIQVIAVSGNHDSGERVSFAGRILESRGLHIAGALEEPLRKVMFEDEYGTVAFWCLPFIKPSAVGTSSDAEAVEEILSRQPMPLSLNQRNVLVTHFFVVGERGEQPELSDSESDVRVGGLEGVPASLFVNFSYVALGHIHKPQHMGKGKVYYAGSPLKYSFSEAKWEKSINIVELGEPGEVTVRKVPLVPLRDMRCIRGRLAELMSPEAAGEHAADYILASLTDTEELIDPMGTLRSVYPNVLQIQLEKNRENQDGEYVSRIQGRRKGAAELFSEFYEMLKGEPMDGKRMEIVEEAAREAEES